MERWRKWDILLLTIFFMTFITSGCRKNNDNNSSAAPAAGTEYAKSATCEQCHEAIYKQWIKSGHNMKFQVPSNPPGVIADVDSNGVNDFKDFRKLGDATNAPLDVDWANYFAAGTNPNLNYNASTGNYEVIIAGNVYPISYTLGGHRWKQRYVTTIGNSKYILPIQYNMITEQTDRAGKQEWTTYDPGHWYNTGTFAFNGFSIDQSWEKRCLACHSTGTSDLQQNASGEWTAKFSEPSITCEACHGPSKNHVGKGGGKGTTVNPSKLSIDKGVEVCGSCHVRGKSRKGETFDKNGNPTGTHGFPWSLADKSFTPGQKVSDYYVFENITGSKVWPDTFETAKSHHQQYLDYRYDKHFKAGVTCWDCHEPHGSDYRSDLKGNPERNDLCLSCHGLGKPNQMSNIDLITGNIQGHTHHNVDPNDVDQPAAGHGSLCSSCHYPFTAKSGISYDIRSHNSKVIYPVESFLIQKSGSRLPNSCMSGNCHTTKDISATKWNITVDANLDAASVFVGNTDAVAYAGGHFSAGGRIGNVAPRAHIWVKENVSGASAKYFSLSASNGLALPNVRLEANVSYDPNRTTATGAAPLTTYTWVQTLGKQDLSGSLGNTEQVTFTIVGAANAGEYRFELVVSDSQGRQSAPYTVSIFVRP